MKSKGDFFIDKTIIMSFNDIQKVSGQKTYSGIRISFFEEVDIEKQREAILNKFNKKGKEKVIRISSPQKAIEQITSILGVLTLIISFISGIALFSWRD